MSPQLVWDPPDATETPKCHSPPSSHAAPGQRGWPQIRRHWELQSCPHPVYLQGHPAGHRRQGLLSCSGFRGTWRVWRAQRNHFPQGGQCSKPPMLAVTGPACRVTLSRTGTPRPTLLSPRAGKGVWGWDRALVAEQGNVSCCHQPGCCDTAPSAPVTLWGAPAEVTPWVTRAMHGALSWLHTHPWGSMTRAGTVTTGKPPAPRSLGGAA